MDSSNLPKKILRVKDCTFILPDNFVGTTEDAFEELLRYQAVFKNRARFIDKADLRSTFTLAAEEEDARFCGSYAIYELIDGEYLITLGPGDIPPDTPDG